jgi:hypothetical protein
MEATKIVGPVAKQSPQAHLSRVSAMLSAIEQLSEELEDCVDPKGFSLVTAVEACVAEAQRELDAATSDEPA